MPFSINVLLESAPQNVDGFVANESDATGLAAGNGVGANAVELPFNPARVVLQDFTGVPCAVDRAAMQRAGGRAAISRPPRA